MTHSHSNDQRFNNRRGSLAPKYCELCGYDRIIQRHRIIPGRDGGKYVLGNVIALCPTHHGEADKGWITKESLFEVIRKRVETTFKQVILPQRKFIESHSGEKVSDEPEESHP